MATKWQDIEKLSRMGIFYFPQLLFHISKVFYSEAPKYAFKANFHVSFEIQYIRVATAKYKVFIANSSNLTSFVLSPPCSKLYGSPESQHTEK